MIELKPAIEPKPALEPGSSQTKSSLHQDAAPSPARQRDEAAVLLNPAVITGLSPMQTTLQECGASAASWLCESPGSGCIRAALSTVHGRVEIRSTIQAQIEDLVANAKAAPENSEVDDKLTAEGSRDDSRRSARSGAVAPAATSRIRATTSIKVQ